MTPDDLTARTTYERSRCNGMADLYEGRDRQAMPWAGKVPRGEPECAARQ
jgi:hypothetical protein